MKRMCKVWTRGELIMTGAAAVALVLSTLFHAWLFWPREVSAEPDSSDRPAVKFEVQREDPIADVTQPLPEEPLREEPVPHEPVPHEPVPIEPTPEEAPPEPIVEAVSEPAPREPAEPNPAESPPVATVDAEPPSAIDPAPIDLAEADSHSSEHASEAGDSALDTPRIWVFNVSDAERTIRAATQLGVPIVYGVGDELWRLEIVPDTLAVLDARRLPNGRYELQRLPRRVRGEALAYEAIRTRVGAALGVGSSRSLEETEVYLWITPRTRVAADRAIAADCSDRSVDPEAVTYARLGFAEVGKKWTIRVEELALGRD